MLGNFAEMDEKAQTSLLPREADISTSLIKGHEELRDEKPDADQERNDALGEKVSRFRVIATDFSYPPNAFILKAEKKHSLATLYVGFPCFNLLLQP